MKLLSLIIFVSLNANAASVVETKIDEHKALVKIDGPPLNVGDKVIMIQQICSGAKAKVCKQVKDGFGTVTLVRPEKHYEVQFESGVSFKEGQELERSNK